MVMSDNKIWKRIKKGDVKSFELLFSRYHDQLCLYSYRLVADEDAAEEIVNDVYLKIWNKKNQIVINVGIKSYLFRSVFNASIDFIHKNTSKQQIKNIDIDQQINQLVDSNEEYLFDFLHSEALEKDVLNAIELLPTQCRKIFCLSRFELLTYAEISERLNISVNTVKTQISRALGSLKKQLQKYL
jgi:RNA polymerase sigma-70 factor (ECF subfamily)